MDTRSTRRLVIDVAARRQRPGYGSRLSRLEGRMEIEAWWMDVRRC
ncbi:MAG: hypothetical protein ACREPA_02565 [Candidatus Dormibacteraceae bacterium]